MTREPTLLIVDDDPRNLESYAMGFARQPYRLLQASGGAQALEILREEPIDIVLTDLKMPEVDGMEVVRAAAAHPTPPVTIVVTAYGTIETAVEAMRLGAFDYITKPVNLLELRTKINKALEVRSLRVRNEELQGLLTDKFKFEGVIGVSKVMQDLIEHSRRAANSKASVLIEGESGTGKELFARAIHFNSPRAAGPFVPIHCAAIPETLMESELFGAEKGAFTGAVQRRTGQFEAAHKGTVFLDELAEVSPATQVKLLRVLEQREITRVGSNKSTPIDIRLVAATNKNLEGEIKAGRFREDLYYRLNVVRLHIPPLRERPEDIPPLVHYFLKELCRQNNTSLLQITPSALQCLVQAPWTGNIRELSNTIEQMVVFATTPTIHTADLPTSFQPNQRPSSPHAGPTPLNTQEDQTLGELERKHIIKTLQAQNQNRTHAARSLGISRRTLQRKLKELGLEDKKNIAQDK